MRICAKRCAMWLRRARRCQAAAWTIAMMPLASRARVRRAGARRELGQDDASRASRGARDGFETLSRAFRKRLTWIKRQKRVGADQAPLSLGRDLSLSRSRTSAWKPPEASAETRDAELTFAGPTLDPLQRCGGLQMLWRCAANARTD